VLTREGSRDVNGYPPPVYPRVKTLLGCGYGGIFSPDGYLSGWFFHPSGVVGVGTFLLPPYPPPVGIHLHIIFWIVSTTYII
jgi:hypothetical protein